MREQMFPVVWVYDKTLVFDVCMSVSQKLNSQRQLVHIVVHVKKLKGSSETKSAWDKKKTQKLIHSHDKPNDN